MKWILKFRNNRHYGCQAMEALRPVYTGDFCRSNSMQFLWRECCNFKIARVNQVRFSVRFVAAISQGFRTCLKVDATSSRQKLHRVAEKKIARVNGPLCFVLSHINWWNNFAAVKINGAVGKRIWKVSKIRYMVRNEWHRFAFRRVRTYNVYKHLGCWDCAVRTGNHL